MIEFHGPPSPVKTTKWASFTWDLRKKNNFTIFFVNIDKIYVNWNDQKQTCFYYSKDMWEHTHILKGHGCPLSNLGGWNSVCPLVCMSPTQHFQCEAFKSSQNHVRPNISYIIGKRVTLAITMTMTKTKRMTKTTKCIGASLVPVKAKKWHLKFFWLSLVTFLRVMLLPPCLFSASSINSTTSLINEDTWVHLNTISYQDCSRHVRHKTNQGDSGREVSLAIFR